MSDSWKTGLSYNWLWGWSLFCISVAEAVSFWHYAFIVAKHNLCCFQPQLLNFLYFLFVVCIFSVWQVAFFWSKLLPLLKGVVLMCYWDCPDLVGFFLHETACFKCLCHNELNESLIKKFQMPWNNSCLFWIISRESNLSTQLSRGAAGSSLSFS